MTINFMIDIEAHEATEHAYTACELLEHRVATILRADHNHIGKKNVFHKYHISRSINKEMRLRKSMKLDPKGSGPRHDILKVNLLKSYRQ